MVRRRNFIKYIFYIVAVLIVPELALHVVPHNGLITFFHPATNFSQMGFKRQRTIKSYTQILRIVIVFIFLSLPNLTSTLQ